MIHTPIISQPTGGRSIVKQQQQLKSLFLLVLFLYFSTVFFEDSSFFLGISYTHSIFTHILLIFRAYTTSNFQVPLRIVST